MFQRGLACGAGLIAGVWGMALDAFAQPAYPSKPIRIVVPFAAGGPADTTARTLASRLTEALGQQVIVDNRGGAGGIIGIDMVAKAPPDGHSVTLMSSSIAIFPSVHKTMPYDLFRDLIAVTDVLSAPFSLVVHPSLPVKSAADLVKLAKAKPGELRYPSAGVGGTNHLAGVQFNLLAGVDTTHVPYKGTGPALMDLAAGQVQFQFSMVLAVTPLVQAGKLRLIGVASRQRLVDLPSVPTVMESGVPGYEAAVWYGLWTTGGVSREIVTRLHSETARALALSAVRQKLSPGGAQLGGNKPEAFEAFVRNEVAKWSKVVKAAGVAPE
jgi:tripartite-type tricarboxylate transporter receptor subunit TctC